MRKTILLLLVVVLLGMTSFAMAQTGSAVPAAELTASAAPAQPVETKAVEEKVNKFEPYLKLSGKVYSELTFKNDPAASETMWQRLELIGVGQMTPETKAIFMLRFHSPTFDYVDSASGDPSKYYIYLLRAELDSTLFDGIVNFRMGRLFNTYQSPLFYGRTIWGLDRAFNVPISIQDAAELKINLAPLADMVPVKLLVGTEFTGSINVENVYFGLLATGGPIPFGIDFRFFFNANMPNGNAEADYGAKQIEIDLSARPAELGLGFLKLYLNLSMKQTGDYYNVDVNGDSAVDYPSSALGYSRKVAYRYPGLGFGDTVVTTIGFQINPDKMMPELLEWFKMIALEGTWGMNPEGNSLFDDQFVNAAFPEYGSRDTRDYKNGLYFLISLCKWGLTFDYAFAYTELFMFERDEKDMSEWEHFIRLTAAF